MMLSQALEFLLDGPGISTSSDLFDRLKEPVLQLGFGRYELRLKPDRNARERSELVIGDYPQAWHEAYEQAGYVRIDPVMLHCMHNVTPIVWTERLYSSPQQHSLRALAVAHGLEHGVTFALHGPQGQFGTLGLNLQARDADQAQAMIRHHMGTLSMLRDAALQAALALMVPPAPVTQVKLTRREKEILRWSAFGKTSWEISNICCCSEANVDYHFKNIRRKFSVTTRSAAVVQALSMQLIQI
ncbi:MULTISPECIES: LuxR family transcriptional regulator [unclassified Pseudomonas]|uniref:helix-turn-helix transcriptional regulator n=1 Tax=unclassified Pseudomonas TaxID=196821 RepID=UPI000CD1EE16|nr:MULTISPECIES: LuxR family transcriptional regulator [unclassified Pseudomonas]POA13904.1 LuxR family transcriptional regulator [Pseudomonas sp. MPBD7-1]